MGLLYSIPEAIVDVLNAKNSEKTIYPDGRVVETTTRNPYITITAIFSLTIMYTVGRGGIVLYRPALPSS
jgi:hypothetical protein